MNFWSIDGSIGSGKSTVIEKLNKRLGLKIAEEPVHEWGEWLEKYYQDKNRWGFSFQMKVILGQAKVLSNLTENEFIIMERSPQTVYHVFASMLKDEQIIDPIEYDLINEFIEYNTKPVNTIYLKCNPETCFARIQSRGREAEQSIDMNYLDQLHKKYENMPNSYVIDSSQSEEKVYDDIVKILISHGYIKEE